MRLAIDTNIYAAARRGEKQVLDRLTAVRQIDVPFIVLAELRAGFLGGTKPAQNEAELQKFLAAPGVNILYADEKTTHQYSDLWNWLKGKGTPIPQNDVWIAALCLQHGLTRYTRDAHFEQLPKLSRA